MIRVQKYLSQLGLSSRREAEKWILEGRIAINGKIVQQLGTLIDPENDQLSIDGQPVVRKEPPKVYWLLHKPDMVLTSSRSEDGKPTIYDLPSLQSLTFRVSPVGRLDFRTEGLLLLSNDGDFVHRMTHPSYKVPRHYYALTTGKLTEAQMRQIRRGVALDDGPAENIEIHYAHGKKLGAGRGSWYIVTVHEGRNRLVRRIFEHFELKVVRLIRYGIGPIRLPESLKPGEYQQLSSQDIKTLKQLVQL